MIAALFAVFRGFSISQKLGAGGVLAAVILSVFVIGVSKGVEWCENEQARQYIEQSNKANLEASEQLKQTTTALATQSAQIKKVHEAKGAIEKEKIVYVKQAGNPCVLDRSYVSLIDSLSRVPWGGDRVQYADGSTGVTDQPSSATVTTLNLLQLYSDAVTELAELKAAYDALVLWERERYRVEKAYYDNQ